MCCNEVRGDGSGDPEITFANSGVAGEACIGSLLSSPCLLVVGGGCGGRTCTGRLPIARGGPTRTLGDKTSGTGDDDESWAKWADGAAFGAEACAEQLVAAAAAAVLPACVHPVGAGMVAGTGGLSSRSFLVVAPVPASWMMQCLSSGLLGLCLRESHLKGVLKTSGASSVTATPSFASVLPSETSCEM
mmetsp:Transcript_40452/g.86845  ORF Transcript_40452/g.86845 Transcript_40452/m.86845 type:complete len:189 (+) Transcript_40452:924-1490(+)